MGATVLAILLATGLGLIAGGYYSVMGWIVVSALLFMTTLVAVIAASTPIFTAVLWIMFTFAAFNAGLVLSLVIRTSAAPQHA